MTTDITHRLARIKLHVADQAFNGQMADDIVQEAIDEIKRLRGAHAEAIAAESEACARRIEEYLRAGRAHRNVSKAEVEALLACADAIRKRS